MTRLVIAILMLAAGVAGVVLLLPAMGRPPGAPGGPGAPGAPGAAAVGATGGAVAVPAGRIVTVERGPITVSIVCAGEIEGADIVKIESEVQHIERDNQPDRRPTVKWLIDDGTTVKAGDLLMQVTSDIVDEAILDRQLKIAEADLEVAQAQEQLNVAKVQADADVMLAQDAYKQSQMDLEHYIMGQFPVSIEQQELQIKVATTEHANAVETLKWSQTLLDEGYITESDLNADRLRLQKAEVSLETSRGLLALMKQFDYKRKSAQLQSELRQREFLVEQAKFQGKSNIRTAESRLLAAQKNLEREQKLLADYQKQLEATRVTTPVDGIVVQAATFERDDDDEPHTIGSTIRYKEDLFYVFQGRALAVDLKLPISKIGWVRVGQRVYVTPEGYPGTKLAGRVTDVALLVSTDRRNPSMQWYNVVVRLEDTMDQVVYGMNCSGEIICETIHDATVVPIAAVQWRQEKRGDGRGEARPYVLVPEGRGYSRRDVQLGPDNTQMVQIVSGLTPGDKILVTSSSDVHHVPAVAGAE